MNKKFLILIGIVGLSTSLTPLSFGDNAFCNMDKSLKNQEELIKDNIVLVEFLKVLPHAELTRATAVDESNPGQTSMSWSSGVYSLDIHILEFDENIPFDCFVAKGYRLNVPHLPEMIGLDYHKDHQIVLQQIDELEPKYVKGGPEPEEPEPYADPDNPNRPCPPGLVLEFDICVEKCPSGTPNENGICLPNCGPNTFLNEIGVCELIDDRCKPDAYGNFYDCVPHYDYWRILFNSPIAYVGVFGILGLIVGVPIVVIYYLRRKRKT